MELTVQEIGDNLGKPLPVPRNPMPFVLFALKTHLCDYGGHQSKHPITKTPHEPFCKNTPGKYGVFFS